MIDKYSKVLHVRTIFRAIRVRSCGLCLSGTDILGGFSIIC